MITNKQLDNLIKPLPKEERRLRIIDKSKLIDNGDGTYDYNGTIDCVGARFDSLLDLGYNFRTVKGSFYCNNTNLISLEGAPKEVTGNFDCFENYLTTLKGAPLKVGGSFDCSSNELTSLEGGPSEVRREFECSYNYLTTLEGAPKKCGRFVCFNNDGKSGEELKKTVVRDYQMYFKYEKGQWLD